MRLTTLILAASLTSACLGLTGCGTSNNAAHQDTAADRADDTPLQGSEAILTVYGMSCPLCANNVNESLMKVPGVTSVDVDMGSGRTRVGLDGTTQVTRRQLAEAVDRSGFSLQAVETP